MEPEQTPADILLRLSLVGGFTLRRLRELGAALRKPFLPGFEEEGRGSAVRKGAAAIDSRDAGERAARVREACRRAGIEIVHAGSDAYPSLLREVPDAPLVLYVKGSPAPDASLAVVGSRYPTAPGAEFARVLARDLAMAGWAVVSGLARGIDAAAHEGALRGGGRTFAVLGCGVDVVYPSEARRLRDRIVEQGGVLSEYPPGTLPLPHHFPARNRIISGLSRGVVVAEAAARSGALITARCALEQGREVMAVPGNPLLPHTRGSNGLLRDGAAPVTDPVDVLAALGRPAAPRARTGAESSGSAAGRHPPGTREREILRFLSAERHVDEIAESLRIPVPELLPLLLEMEFAKLLVRRPGDYYKKMSDIRG